MTHRAALLALAVSLAFPVVAHGRTWTDSTGNYSIDADMIAFNDATIVLKKKNRQLVAVPIDKLSKEDQKYLASKEAADQMLHDANAVQTWTMRSGLKLIGRVVDYGVRDVTVQRRYGKIYVNDRRLDNLPEVYQKMLPKIIENFEKIKLDDKRALDAWAAKLQGDSATFTCEGVLLELDNGDAYGIPFFFFSDADQRILKPGWDRWVAADKDQAKRKQERLLLRSQAQAYQQDRMMNQQIALMQLQMQGYDAGLFDLWEVGLVPGPGVAGSPLTVVVPARDSRSAAIEAVRRNPGFVSGPVAKVSRKR
jgi:hypothetical protein